MDSGRFCWASFRLYQVPAIAVTAPMQTGPAETPFQISFQIRSYILYASSIWPDGGQGADRKIYQAVLTDPGRTLLHPGLLAVFMALVVWAVWTALQAGMSNRADTLSLWGAVEPCGAFADVDRASVRFGATGRFSGGSGDDMRADSWKHFHWRGSWTVLVGSNWCRSS